jgi:hypothetical protein
MKTARLWKPDKPRLLYPRFHSCCPWDHGQLHNPLKKTMFSVQNSEPLSWRVVVDYVQKALGSQLLSYF